MSQLGCAGAKPGLLLNSLLAINTKSKIQNSKSKTQNAK
jgi:hypothetical protein